jgi:PBP1b-binding outer membrane lipoprotein LpoB
MSRFALIVAAAVLLAGCGEPVPESPVDERLDEMTATGPTAGGFEDAPDGGGMYSE